MNYQFKKLFKTLIFIGIVCLFGISLTAFGQGLDGLESGVRRGTSTLQKIGFVFGSLVETYWRKK